MVENGGARSLIDHFAVLADPRQSWKVVYPLPEVLLLVLCGTLAGAEDFVEIRRWGMVNQGFLRRFLPFAEGIPSHDTLNDIVNALDGDLFAACFSEWVASLCESEPDIVAIDGKTSRRSTTKPRSATPCIWSRPGPAGLRGQVERDHRDPAAPGAPRAHGRLGHHRCDGLPGQDRPDDPRARGRLPARRQGELAEPAWRDRALLRGRNRARPLPDHRRRPRPHRVALSRRQPRHRLPERRPALPWRTALPRSRRHRHGGGRGRARPQEEPRTTLLSLLHADRRAPFRPRRPLPLAHREPPALGARRGLP